MDVRRACLAVALVANVVAAGSVMARHAPAAGVAAGAVGLTTSSQRPLDDTGALTAQDWAWVSEAPAQGEKVVLAQAESVLGDDPLNHPRCHQLTHELGRRAYGRLHDLATALAPATSWCGGGYLHGVYEGWGRAVPLTTISGDIHRLCEGMAPDEAGKCAHGVGHAIMQHVPDLDASFALCSQMGGLNAWECMNGVLMIYGQLYLRPGAPGGRSFDVNGFCSKVPTSFLDRCHYEAGQAWLGITGSGDRTRALQECTTLTGGSAAAKTCAAGVGNTVLDATGQDGVAAAKLCETGPSQLAEDCVAGAYRNLVQFSKASNVCGDVPPRWAPVCVGLLDGTRADPRTASGAAAAGPGPVDDHDHAVTSQ